MTPPTRTDPAADALEMIQQAVDAAHNPRLGTDTRLGQALTAITYLTRWARYQDDRLRYLAAEVRLLRDAGARV